MTSPRFPLALAATVVAILGVAASPNSLRARAQTPPPVKLAPGKTIEDVGKWAAEMKGPPPGKPIGGIPAFMKGKTAFFEVNLTAGDYGMICFVPDAKDGKPHVAHGMAQTIKVT